MASKRGIGRASISRIVSLLAFLPVASRVPDYARLIGALVLDERMPAERKVKHLMDWYTPTLIQQALARFLSEGHLLRHIRRSHARHAQRRARLLARLHGDLSPWLEALPAMAGFHLAARLRVPVASDALVAMARLADLELATLDPFYVTPPPTCAGLLLGFGAIDLLDIDPALDRLAMVLSALAPEPARVV